MKFMRLFVVALAIMLAGLPLADAKKSSGSGSSEKTYVKGYNRKDGTYVAPHYRTKANGTKNDNWSTRGNINPYTGKAGTKPRDEDGAANTRAQYSAPPSEVPSRTSRAAQNDQPATPSAAPEARGSTMLNALKSGMTKDEVLKLMGEPNVRTERKWYYSSQGTVIFEGGKVMSTIGN